MKNERTSKRVAKIAGKILRVPLKVASTCLVGRMQKAPIYYETHIDWRDIRALAASALTQTADKSGDIIGYAKRPYNPKVPQPVVAPSGGYDDIGFDPRDGSSGNPEKQRVPKQPKRKARREEPINETP